MERNLNTTGFIDEQLTQIRETIGDKKALCALSGGVDSSVCAVLVQKAIGRNLTCIFVDTGLMRKDERKQVEDIFKNQFDIQLICIDAEERFLAKLKNISDPEQKRKIIGEEFIRVFEEEANKIGEVDYLIQGTIYPDITESGGEGAGFVKSHHNVGGLPKNIAFKGLVEPIRLLYKNEVRAVGRELGLPDKFVDRQPFPGPGLAVRCLGEITKEKLDILREADFIFREEVDRASLNIWQYFAVLTDIKSVGVKNDTRTYNYTIALRAVNTSDAVVADWVKIPYDILETVSDRIVAEVENVNRVVYDITRKPPATIEWE